MLALFGNHFAMRSWNDNELISITLSNWFNFLLVFVSCLVGFIVPTNVIHNYISWKYTHYQPHIHHPQVHHKKLCMDCQWIILLSASITRMEYVPTSKPNYRSKLQGTWQQQRHIYPLHSAHLEEQCSCFLSPGQQYSHPNGPEACQWIWTLVLECP